MNKKKIKKNIHEQKLNFIILLSKKTVLESETFHKIHEGFLFALWATNDFYFNFFLPIYGIQ